MVNWQDAYDIKYEDGTFNVYKKNSYEMIAYCKTEDEAVSVAQTYFLLAQEIIDSFLLETDDES